MKRSYLKLSDAHRSDVVLLSQFSEVAKAYSKSWVVLNWTGTWHISVLKDSLRCNNSRGIPNDGQDAAEAIC